MTDKKYLDGDGVAQVWAAVKQYVIDEAVQDGSITGPKIANGAVTGAKLADGAVRPSGTSFSSEIQGTTVTTLTEIDPSCTTYENYVASSDGTFVANANLNSHLFVCPEDGYAITTNAYRLFVVGAAPNVEAGTVQIVSTLINNNTTSAITATIPNKGDLVLVVENKADALLVATQSAMPVTIPRLTLTEIQESFNRYSTRHDATSFGNDLLDIHSATGLLNTTTGGITTEQTTYTTYYFRVPVPTLTVTCTNGFRALLAHSDPTDGLLVNNIQTLYTYAAGRVETFTATYGQWVCISVGNSGGAIDLKTDLVETFTLPSLELDYLQADGFYRYEQVDSARYLYIYCRSGENLVRWELHNVPSAGINSDTWQIGHVLGYNIVDGMPANEVELVAGGEFELAFKEHGAADYCGGNNHGDETTDTFVLHIDGKQVADLTTLDGAYHKFNRIDAIEIATVNRCDTPSEDILKHQKIWVFENGTVKVKQTVKFLETLVIDGGLVCMFAANRASFPYGIRQGSTEIEDMSAQGYTQLSTSNNEMFYLMYGSNATAKISSNSHNADGTSRLWINDTSTINKLYYSYYGDLNSTYPKTIPSGTVWQIESEYDVSYS